MRDTFINYNAYWVDNPAVKPLIILVGGYCGTGKSTFTNLLASRLEHINVLPTGIVRSIYQSVFSQNKSPVLYGHTYTLYRQEKYKDLPFTEAVVNSYTDQCTIVGDGIGRLIQFAETEGQQYILEGNHILPSFAQEYQDQKNIISLFFKVSDRDMLLANMCSPTHKRNLSDEEKKAAYILHDYLVQECDKYHLPIFEYSDSSLALQYVENTLQKNYKLP